MYPVPFLRYSASKNGVTLKPGVTVVQGHWKWRRSIDDHIRLCVGPPKIYGSGSAIVNIALSCTVFELFDVELYRDLEIWVKISICQSSMVHEGCWVNCPTRVGNLEASTVCWTEATRRAELSRNQAAVDRICRVAVKDVMLNQEDKSKRHRLAR